ncbi:caspase-9-like isoform X2 [Dunckerocampus dactyliophorus]|uniref:caspase-9-like isoform X2 n=1 Tax=Dunckerocampus dactyliophorus TaxID=161453 RepID=UPI002404BBD5|nr:caspase-9-like isoform X2 [Dunckerocampus dactyliophorus]XP_054625869.1 caspase-9-like isoform X2 [Dunckerocampus dactyliophorus]
MEESHKKVLQRYRINIVTGLDPSGVLDRLLEKGVFTQDMIDKIKSSGTRRDQARQLSRDLETQGSRAFPLFLESLHESEQHGLAELLQSGAPAVQGSASNRLVRPVVRTLPVSSAMDFQKQIKSITAVHPVQTPTLSPERENLQSQTQARTRMQGRTRRDSLQSYKMDSSPCGHCLIINNVAFEPQSELSDRSGSNIDCDKLERRFQALNFMVEVRTNLKQRKIKQELLDLSKKDHSPYDCCVVIILSHGTEVSHNRFPGAVYGVDGQYVQVQHITNYLDGKHCSSLQGKPKLFFIQACGGGEKDRGFEVSDEVEPSNSGEDDQTDAIPMSSSSDSLSMSDEPDARATLPTPSDILVSYSTFPGYVSWRDTQSGSWYIETLDRILEENAATDDLVTMLMMVVARSAETPVETNVPRVIQKTL